MQSEIAISYFLDVSNPVQVSYQQIMQEDIVEVPTEIYLGVGETYTLNLQGLATAGYRWSYEVIDSEDLVDTSITTAALSQFGNGESPPVIGSSANEIFTLKAKKKGSVSIRLFQHRSWEQTQPPIEEYLLKINICDS